MLFSYDAESYKVTEYKKNGKNQINSSAISSTLGLATTDIIKIEEKDITNINLGLVKIPKFDLSLAKTVSRIVVQNNEGTKEYKFNNNYAKTDINSKYVNNTLVLVEYKIRVTNEGELAGKVKEIVDYMPRDMVFSSDLNKTWRKASNGNLYSN